ncbi:formylglycine-generating enzyme family protein [Streptomyces sp. NPDC056987]|uniref:formylglycine-generating enzyme family protein n=1 Tax=Streptomyces sp. NPDC056987 TaxID=3345988 RepID=UPI00363082AF
MVLVPGGEFLMGAADAGGPEDGEGPVRPVRLSPFRNDIHAVSNNRFAGFVDATGYVTEAEWEYAARGGLAQRRYPWGDALDPDGYRCNIWRGTFPSKNTAADGYRGTAPVDAFEPNGYGLYNTFGNVWEWCADWWTLDHASSLVTDPKGPARGRDKVIRGGSLLCHKSYCNRYRVAARAAGTPDGARAHTGFRCARRA